MTSVCIVNPAAAGGRAARRRPLLEARLQHTFPTCDVWTTSGPGDATRLAARAAENGVETVMSFGGDGTHSEVVAGLLSVSQPPAFLPLPAGTGGDFCRQLQGGHDLAATLHFAATAQARPIDVGRVEYLHDGEQRWFLNLACCGLNGVVCRHVERLGGLKRVSGAAAFALASLSAGAVYRRAKVRITLDEHELDPRRITMVAVANGRFWGGGMRFAPEAELDDGLFDVMVIEHDTVGQLSLLPHMFAGTQERLRFVSRRRARRIRIEPDDDNNAWTELDGEPHRCPPLVMEVVHRRLPLLYAGRERATRTRG